MTNEEFFAWLLGFATLANSDSLLGWQIVIIKNHANLAKEIDGALTPVSKHILAKLSPGCSLKPLLDEALLLGKNQ